MNTISLLKNTFAPAEVVAAAQKDADEIALMEGALRSVVARTDDERTKRIVLAKIRALEEMRALGSSVPASLATR